MSYRYKVRDSLGKIQEGTLDFEEREEALAALEADGLSILTLEESDDDGPSLFSGISQTEIIYTASQLSIMVDTGITLSQAIEGLCRQETNPALKTVLLDIKQHVEGGEDFSAALARHPRHFDRTFVALVRASEKTGTLGEMLDRIAAYLRNDSETKAKVRAALAYPGVMLVIAVGVTLFLLTYIMPKFTPLFARRGMKLPISTQAMMALSQSLTAHWHYWAIGMAIVIGGLLYFRTTETGRRFFDYVKLHVPILGPMFRKMILSRSVRTLGAMIRSGVTALEALRLTAESSGNVYYEDSWQRVIEQVTQGKRIADVLEGDPLFPPTLIQMIASGEETAKLDMVLEKVSSYYDRELELTIKTTTSLIEPIMIVCMGVVVGTIAMSLLLPIFQLSRPVKH